MCAVEKACPLVLRQRAGRYEILAFTHPTAGCQVVKGTIEPGETPEEAACRELREESGCVLDTMEPLGTVRIDGGLWHVFATLSNDLPDTWTHQTEYDLGHAFAFFWYPLEAPLDDRWDALFHALFAQVHAPLSAWLAART